MSISFNLHPIAVAKNGHPTRVLAYRQNFKKLNIQGFDFTNGFKFSDVPKIEKLNCLSINMFELKFHKDVFDDWSFRLSLFETGETIQMMLMV